MCCRSKPEAISSLSDPTEKVIDLEIPQEDVGPGPDGEKIVDSTYYVLLGVKGNANEAEIKKAYRKQSLINHPDRNVGDETAVARFQAISEAYAVLSDSNARAVYNKQGNKAAVEAAGGEAMADPGQIFSQMFGGQAFEDWIGEISLGKDVSKAFEMSTTEEERDQLKAELAAETETAAADAPGATPATAPAPQQSTISHNAFAEPTASTTTPTPAAGSPRPLSPAGKAAATSATSTDPATAPLASPSATTAAGAAAEVESKAAKEAARRAERERKEAERAKLEQYDRERSEEKKERVRKLVAKLRDRIRPFVEATNPGGPGDAETARFMERIKEETHDLAMESFGVEICHLIGEIYMSKAATYINLHKKAGNILGVKGFFSRVKEKGKMISEGWSFLSTGLDVQRAMKEMEARQAKGEIGEEEQAQIEQDLSGKLLLVAWKGSRFELASVLRQVVDGALTKEAPDVTEAVLLNRAKAIAVTGAILKSVTPDAADAERRELERLVEEANRKRKEKKTGKSAKVASPATTTPASPTPAATAAGAEKK